MDHLTSLLHFIPLLRARASRHPLTSLLHFIPLLKARASRHPLTSLLHFIPLLKARASRHPLTSLLHFIPLLKARASRHPLTSLLHFVPLLRARALASAQGSSHSPPHPMLSHARSLSGEACGTGRAPTYPFVPLLKAKHVVGLASTQVPYEPTIPNQDTTHCTLNTYGIFAWLASWQVRVRVRARGVGRLWCHVPKCELVTTARTIALCIHPASTCARALATHLDLLPQPT